MVVASSISFILIHIHNNGGDDSSQSFCT